MYPLSLSKRDGLVRTPCSSSGGSAVLLIAMGNCGDERGDAGDCDAVLLDAMIGEGDASAIDVRCDAGG
jgi:hypothetical protein